MCEKKNEQMGIQYVEDCMSGKAAFSDSSLFAGCVTSLEGQMKEIALHIHYPECWDTMAYPTLSSAVCEIGGCNPEDCTHKDTHKARSKTGDDYMSETTKENAQTPRSLDGLVGWVSIPVLEEFISETMDFSAQFECEGDEAVAYGINQAMYLLQRLIELNKPNDQVQP